MDIASKLQEYGSYHQNHKNIISHLFGIPLIIFALMIYLSFVVIGVVNVIVVPVSLILSIALIIFYATYNLKLALISCAYLIPMLLLAYILHDIARAHSVWIATICFVIGWALQFIGHIFEKQQPAFVDNLVHLIIGPLFIIIETKNMLTGKNRSAARPPTEDPK